MNSSRQDVGLSRIVDEFLLLVQETAVFHTDPSIQSLLQEAGRALSKIRQRRQLSASRYVIGMVGQTNVGKSTLLNALLGSELAPRRNGPCTAAPIEFVYGPQCRVTAYYRQQLSRPTWKCAGVEAIHERLSALADEAGGETSRSIDKVVVESPNLLLQGGPVIADTPGFGAAQADGAQGTHDEVVRSYLRGYVSQVFWVVLAEQGIGKREKTFHDEFFAEVCDDVVVTGCEDWNAQDCQRFRRRFAQSFSQRMPTFHFVSGREGMRARATHDESGLAAAGITKLASRIRKLGDPHERDRAIQRSLIQLSHDLGYWLRQIILQDGSQRRDLWRPDSWDRFTDSLSDEILRSELIPHLLLKN